MADHERIRLVVLGGAGVGKSAIIRRLLGQGFSERYRPTVEDLYSRECVLGTLTLKVDLLDTAGKSLHLLPPGIPLHYKEKIKEQNIFICIHFQVIYSFQL